MTRHEFTIADVRFDQLAAELEAATGIDMTSEAPDGSLSWMSPDTLFVTVRSDLTAAQEAAMSAAVAAHVPTETLEEARTRLVGSIKDWRNYLIEFVHSVEYPAGSGKMFSVGFADQINWNALWGMRDDPTKIQYPYRITTADERDFHDFTDAADVDACFTLVTEVVKGEIDRARDVLLQLSAATTTEAMEAIAATYVEVMP